MPRFKRQLGHLGPTDCISTLPPPTHTTESTQKRFDGRRPTLPGPSSWTVDILIDGEMCGDKDIATPRPGIIAFLYFKCYTDNEYRYTEQ